MGVVYACRFSFAEYSVPAYVRGVGGFPRIGGAWDLSLDGGGPGGGGACQSCAAFDACRGGCMAAKFFTGLPLDGPDPECVKGYGELRLSAVGPGSGPPPSPDHPPGAGPPRGGPGGAGGGPGRRRRARPGPGAARDP